jgi:hypothetical protein
MAGIPTSLITTSVLKYAPLGNSQLSLRGMPAESAGEHDRLEVVGLNFRPTMLGTKCQVQPQFKISIRPTFKTTHELGLLRR